MFLFNNFIYKSFTNSFIYLLLLDTKTCVCVNWSHGAGQDKDEDTVRLKETASRTLNTPETITWKNKLVVNPGLDQRANQDFQFTFLFIFKELNLITEKSFSLLKVVHPLFTEAKETGMCSFEGFHAAFTFDGLDECGLPLDFQSTSVDVLLTNLSSSAHLWIATHLAAAIIPTTTDNEKGRRTAQDTDWNTSISWWFRLK